MNVEYIVTNEYLTQKGLNLEDYALDGTLINAIINVGLDLLVTRISYLNDDMKGEASIETFLDENPTLVNTFFKAQYRIIHNLVFQNDTSPTDKFVDDIIVFELGLGKINGFQKGLYR